MRTTKSLAEDILDHTLHSFVETSTRILGDLFIESIQKENEITKLKTIIRGLDWFRKGKGATFPPQNANK